MLIELQWHAARWAPGVATVILNGASPAKVPDTVIAEIKSREVDGLIELPKALPPPGLRPGAQVKILAGPFRGFVATLIGLRPRERVEVLLALLGSPMIKFVLSGHEEYPLSSRSTEGGITLAARPESARGTRVQVMEKFQHDEDSRTICPCT